MRKGFAEPASVSWNGPAGVIAESARRIEDWARNYLRTVERIQRREIGEYEFALLLSEPKGPLRLSEGQIADILNVSKTTVYRWMNGAVTPNRFARGSILSELRPLIENAIEARIADATTLLREGRRADISDSRMLGLTTTRLVPESAAGDVILRHAPGQSWRPGRSDQGRRPNFIEFVWQSPPGDEIILLPPAFVRDACVTVNAARVIQIDPDGKRNEIEANSTGLCLLHYLSNGEVPYLPGVKFSVMPHPGQHIVTGTLALTSELGLPFELTAKGLGIFQARLEGSLKDKAGTSQCFAQAVPVTEEGTMPAPNLPNSVATFEMNEYAHKLAVDNGNFKIYCISEVAKASDARSLTGENKNLGRLNLRVLYSDHDDPIWRRDAVYASRHFGAETFMPLFGVWDAYALPIRILDMPDDRESSFAIASAEAQLDQKEFAAPILLAAPDHNIHGTNNAGHWDMLSIDPNEIAHGFTAFTTKAAALSLSVRHYSDSLKKWSDVAASHSASEPFLLCSSGGLK